MTVERYRPLLQLLQVPDSHTLLGYSAANWRRALAARGFDRPAGRLRTAMASVRDPRAQMTRFAGCYVRFAFADRALFNPAYNAHRDKSAYPDLMPASQAVFNLLVEPARVLVGAERAPDLVIAIGAVAHGFAALLLEQAFGTDDLALPAAERAAQNAVRSLIAGSTIGNADPADVTTGDF